MNPVALLRRYLAAGARHRWRALALAWLVCLAGWAGIYAIPNMWASSTRVYADADAILGMLLRGIAIDNSPASQVEILQRTLLSRPNLERIVQRTPLEAQADTRANREEILARLAKEIRITTQTRNLFTIDYRDRDPRIAHAVVDTTLNLFMEAAAATDRQQMENARGFLMQQIASYEVQLRQAERRRAEFQTRYLDILPSAQYGGVTRLEAARARLIQVQGELVDARRRRELAQQQLDSQPATLPAAALAAGGAAGPTRLAEAERQLAELRLRFTDQHPDVIAARGFVAAIRSGAVSGGGDGGTASRNAASASVGRGAAVSNPLYEQMRVRLLDVEGQISSLERQEREGQAEVARLDAVTRSEPEVQAQFLNLDRDYTVLRRNYEELLARRESLQLAGAARNSSDRVRLEVVDPPTVPTQPVAMKRPLLALGVLLLGLGAGGALAFLLVQLDRTFYTLQDLRKLGPPVLGSISGRVRRSTPLGRLGFAGGLAMLLVAYGGVVAGVPGMLWRMLA